MAGLIETADGPKGALLIVSESISAASVVVQMEPSRPRRFKAMEVDADGARLRRMDGVPVPLDCEKAVAEAAATCDTVVVREIDLETGREEEYEIDIVTPAPASGVTL